MTTEKTNKTRENAEFQGWLNVYNHNEEAAALHPRHAEFLKIYNSQSKLTIK